MSLTKNDLVHAGDQASGHGRLVDRRLTRRGFLGLAASGAAVVATGSLARPSWAESRRDPRPINGGAFPPYRFYFPAYKEDGPPAVFEQSTITDFKGAFASTDVSGWGRDNTNRELYFRCDMRMMVGRYVGTDEKVRHGAFGFI